MRYFLQIILITIILVALPACNPPPVNSSNPTQRILVGPGPEDMVLDTLNGEPRLIISCAARRESAEPYGEMISLTLKNGSKTELIRYNEPADLRFRPQGIFLDKGMLYVISHESEPDYHPILVYKVKGDSLEFKDLIHTKGQNSPNAITTGPSGEIYLVNDAGKRGSTAEKIFRLKRASLVRLEKTEGAGWMSTPVATDLGFPAGINRIGNKLYVGDAILNIIHVFGISESGLIRLPEIKDVKGNDNIRIHNGFLITTGHIKPFKLIRHIRNKQNHSPVMVYQVDPENGEKNVLFYTDGSLISAGSTAIIFENHLYISQIFEPFILKVQL